MGILSLERKLLLYNLEQVNYLEIENQMKKFISLILLSLLNALLTPLSPVLATEVLKLSTTTSTENSGLLAVLHPAFEETNNIQVHVIAVGTGKALRLGANGDVDAVFVHAPDAEMQYVAQGDFIDRSAVMHNDFVIVGPETDPAAVSNADNVLQVLQKLQAKQVSFISRGDDSGTDKKEKQLWKLAGIEPKGSWYAEVGQGMGAVLRIADNKQGYTLSDRGTQIAYADNMSLKVLFEGDQSLFNPYHVMAVNPSKHQHVRYDLAKKYIDFVVSVQGQRIITDYKKSGQQLFYPDAGKDRSKE